MTTDQHQLHLIMVASPVYWPHTQEVEDIFEAIQKDLDKHFISRLKCHLIRGQEGTDWLKPFHNTSAILLPLSGGVQGQLVSLRAKLRHAALANAYLPGLLPQELSHTLLHRNAHPACTDFFAHCRLSSRPVTWLSTREEFSAYLRAYAATTALQAARILQIGDTEPWVMNSTRDPERFRHALGSRIIPLPSEDLYREFHSVNEDDSEVQRLGQDWWQTAQDHVRILPRDAQKASRVTLAMKRLLERHDADALAMACFSMIGDLDTTSCLALSSLNTAAHTIGACEGDLDAAVTLYLLKQLGADFVWIANPIIHPADYVDLAHCTAPRCVGAEGLPYRLLRHHESGRGVAPEVKLPDGQRVTLARIGANLTELCVHPGLTQSVVKQPTCHTQIRVHLPSSRIFRDTLSGTHVVMSYGDWSGELALCAELLGLKLTGTAGHEISSNPQAEKTPSRKTG